MKSENLENYLERQNEDLERDQCRICLDSEGILYGLVCECRGSVGFMHKKCLELTWASNSKLSRKCELCNQEYNVVLKKKLKPAKQWSLPAIGLSECFAFISLILLLFVFSVSVNGLFESYENFTTVEEKFHGSGRNVTVSEHSNYTNDSYSIRLHYYQYHRGFAVIPQVFLQIIQLVISVLGILICFAILIWAGVRWRTKFIKRNQEITIESFVIPPVTQVTLV